MTTPIGLRRLDACRSVGLYHRARRVVGERAEPTRPLASYDSVFTRGARQSQAPFFVETLHGFYDISMLRAKKYLHSVFSICSRVHSSFNMKAGYLCAIR